MIIFTAALAIVALMLDAYTSRLCLIGGRSEMWPLRYLLIKALGINGGTYGVAVAAGVVVVLVNAISAQPRWGLWLGNLIITALCGLASAWNWRLR